LNKGVNIFRFKVLTQDNVSNIVFTFEKPYTKGNYICKSRIHSNGIGIVGDGTSFGQYNNLDVDFTIKKDDIVECICDFDTKVIIFNVNNITVFEGLNNQIELFLFV